MSTFFSQTLAGDARRAEYTLLSTKKSQIVPQSEEISDTLATH